MNVYILDLKSSYDSGDKDDDMDFLCDLKFDSRFVILNDQWKREIHNYALLMLMGILMIKYIKWKCRWN